jgi:hypothetical protein
VATTVYRRRQYTFYHTELLYLIFCFTAFTATVILSDLDALVKQYSSEIHRSDFTRSMAPSPSSGLAPASEESGARRSRRIAQIGRKSYAEDETYGSDDRVLLEDDEADIAVASGSKRKRGRSRGTNGPASARKRVCVTPRKGRRRTRVLAEEVGEEEAEGSFAAMGGLRTAHPIVTANRDDAGGEMGDGLLLPQEGRAVKIEDNALSSNAGINNANGNEEDAHSSQPPTSSPHRHHNQYQRISTWLSRTSPSNTPSQTPPPSIAALSDGISVMTFEQQYPIPADATPEEEIALLEILKSRSANEGEYEYRIRLAKIRQRNEAATAAEI